MRSETANGRAVSRNPVSNKSPMRTKAGKWYADWRDEHGKRHMKACASKKAAQRMSEKKRREAAAKKTRASAPSAKSPKRGPRRGATNSIAKLRAISRAARVPSNRGS